MDKPTISFKLTIRDFDTLKEIVQRDQERHAALWKRATEQAQVAGEDDQSKEIAATARKALINLNTVQQARERLLRALGLLED